jgi:NADH:ubiquinone oxidoreductase subunit 6 (subunit J)
MILIVYLGALIVLFLFVVMMLNIKSLELNRVINFFPFVFIFVSALFLFFLSDGSIFSLNDSDMFLFCLSFVEWSRVYFFVGSFLSIGFSLYTFNFSLLILISFVLLLAMFGAIILTLVPSRYFFKQDSISQILRLRYLENVKI